MPVLECECNGSILRREFSVSENGLNAGYASIQPIFGNTQHWRHHFGKHACRGGDPAASLTQNDTKNAEMRHIIN